MKSGCRTGERWSTPTGSVALLGDLRRRPSSPAARRRCRASRPGRSTSSIACAIFRWSGLNPYRDGQHLIDHGVDGLALLAAHAAVAGGGGDARALRGAVPSAVFASARQRAVRHAGDRDRPIRAPRGSPRSASPAPCASRTSRGSPRAAPRRGVHGRNVRSSRFGTTLGASRTPASGSARAAPSSGCPRSRRVGHSGDSRRTGASAGRPLDSLMPSSPPSQRRRPQLGLLRREVPELAARPDLREVERAGVDAERVERPCEVRRRRRRSSPRPRRRRRARPPTLRRRSFPRTSSRRSRPPRRRRSTIVPSCIMNPDM